MSAPTQNQALATILFLYRHVLEIELPWLDSVVRAKPSRHLPVVLSVTEVKAVLANLRGDYWLVASLLYGDGLRLLEALRLRVKDIEFEYRQIVARDGKGSKDRVTVLPERLVVLLRDHLGRVEQHHRFAVDNGHGGVELPYAIERKYPIMKPRRGAGSTSSRRGRLECKTEL